MTIRTVWINEGCIACNACENECSSIFHIENDTCIIKAEARVDNISNDNRNERANLISNLGSTLKEKIISAVKSCPIKIIKIQLVPSQAAPSASDSTTTTSKPSPASKINLPKGIPLPSLVRHNEMQAALKDQDTTNVQAAKITTNDISVPIPTRAIDHDLLLLQSELGTKVEEIFQQAGEITCQVAKEHILDTLKLCRDNPLLSYEMLADQTGTHYPMAKEFAFSIVYHLTSLKRNKRLRLRILIPEDFEPESAVPIYPTANWMEREIWDMLGIRFKNHPNMTRILCPENWEGHPLRKDYPVVGLGQRNIDFREDRSGKLMRNAMDSSGNIDININPPEAV